MANALLVDRKIFTHNFFKRQINDSIIIGMLSIMPSINLIFILFKCISLVNTSTIISRVDYLTPVYI